MPKSIKSASFLALEKSYGPKHLRLKIIIYMALRNLVSRRLRTFLTAGGVLIGIGSITFLVSLGLGLQDLVTRQVIGSKSVTAIDVTPPASNIVRLDGANVSKIQANPAVKDVAKSFAAAGKATFGGSGTDAVIYGADQSYLDLSSLHLITGGKLTLEPNEILVNSSLLKLIGLNKAESAVGKTVKLDILVPAATETGKRHIVTDVKIKGVLDTGSGSEIFMSDQFFRSAGVTDYSQLKVVAKDRANVAQIRKQVEALGFTTASPLDTLDQINQVFVFFNFILAGFGGIGMLIAVLGMFNTLTISLLERTREIALMVSLGARRRDIRRLFISEAVALAILGGVAGIMSSWLLGVAINTLLTQMAHARGVNEAVSIFSLPWWLVGETLILVVVVALVVVAYPAWRAVRVNPIDALRHE